MSSKNQSSPMARPSCSGSLICTLAPPSKVAASANSIPVKPSIFFRRRIADATPRTIAATISAWINSRMTCIG